MRVRRHIKQFLFSACLLVFAMSAAVQVCAQTPDYPTKPVRWIVPYSAGASNDVVARLLAQKLTQKWGQPVVIENRAGAGGAIGASLAAKAEPDGYTLLMTNPGSNAIQPVLDTHTSYADKDFTHVILLGAAPLMLSVNQKFPASDVSALITLAKTSPGRLTGGSSGSGGSSHFALELFNLLAGVDILHIPYKGAAPAVNDVASGQVSLIFTTPASVYALLESQKLKALGISGAHRLSSFPAVPTMAEQGIDGFDDQIWFGVSVPTGTPRAIMDKLNRDLNEILQLPDIKERFTALGLNTEGGSPEHFASLVKTDTERLRRLVKLGKINISD